jgi:hypothetical protein
VLRSGTIDQGARALFTGAGGSSGGSGGTTGSAGFSVGSGGIAAAAATDAAGSLAFTVGVAGRPMYGPPMPNVATGAKLAMVMACAAGLRDGASATHGLSVAGPGSCASNTGVSYDVATTPTAPAIAATVAATASVSVPHCATSSLGAMTDSAPGPCVARSAIAVDRAIGRGHTGRRE